MTCILLPLLVVGVIVAVYLSCATAEKMQPWQTPSLMKPKHALMLGVTPNALSNDMYLRKPMRASENEPFADTISNIWLDNPLVACARVRGRPVAAHDPTDILMFQEQSFEDEAAKTM